MRKTVVVMIAGAALALGACTGEEATAPPPTADAPSGTPAPRESGRVATAAPSSEGESASGATGSGQADPSSSVGGPDAAMPSSMPPVPPAPSPEEGATPRATVDPEKVDAAEAADVGAAFVRSWYGSDFRSDGSRREAAERAGQFASDEFAQVLVSGPQEGAGAHWREARLAQALVKVKTQEATDDLRPPEPGDKGTGVSFKVRLTFKGADIEPVEELVHVQLERTGKAWKVVGMTFG